MSTVLRGPEGNKSLPLTFSGSTGSTLSLDGPVAIGTKTPDASAALEVSATSKGLLPPQMSTVLRDLIASPADGLMIFNTDNLRTETFNGITWESVVLAPAANSAVTLAVTDRFIHLTSTDASAKAATMTSTYAGHRIVLNMLSRSSTGTYTFLIDEGTLTLDATAEVAEIYFDGTTWRSLSLLGATIV